MTAEEIKQLLDPVFQKMGELGSQAWDIAIQQVQLEIIHNSVAIAVMALATLGCIVAIKWSGRKKRVLYDEPAKKDRYNTPETWKFVYYWVVGCSVAVWLSSVITTIVCGVAIYSRIVNPAWYVLKIFARLVAPSE